MGGVGGGLFLFVCVCHLSDNSPTSPLALSRSSYLYGTSNKDTRFRLGPPSWAFACLRVAPGTRRLLLPLLGQVGPSSLEGEAGGRSIWGGVVFELRWRGRGLLGVETAEKCGRAPWAWDGGVDRDHPRPSSRLGRTRWGGGPGVGGLMAVGEEGARCH